MNSMNFLLGILLAKDLEPRDKVLTGMLCGFTRMPAAPLLVKPVADKVTEQTATIQAQAKRIREHNDFTSALGGAKTLGELKQRIQKDEDFRNNLGKQLGITISIGNVKSAPQAPTQQSEASAKKTT